MNEQINKKTGNMLIQNSIMKNIIVDNHTRVTKDMEVGKILS
jgi:hypothetical protein